MINRCAFVLCCSYLSAACRICVIHAFRSSFEAVWISYISGSLEEAQIRNMAFSSWATSLTMSFWSEITDGLLSWEDQKNKREEGAETRMRAKPMNLQICHPSQNNSAPFYNFQNTLSTFLFDALLFFIDTDVLTTAANTYL